MAVLSGELMYPALTGGWIGESVRNTTVPASGGITTIETVIQTFTWTAVSTARYKVTAVQSYQSTLANDIVQVRLRWSSGATLSISGTQIRSRAPNCDIANRGNDVTLIATVTGLSGQITVGVTGVRNTGSGQISFFGAGANENTITVEGV